MDRRASSGIMRPPCLSTRGPGPPRTEKSFRIMTYVVAEPCIKCKYTDCVDVCPVDCFYEGENFLVIHPDECIDCGACVPECPTEAIFSEDDLPEKWTEYTELNARLAENWPNIDAKRDSLDEADEFKDVEDKRSLLSEESFSG